MNPNDLSDEDYGRRWAAMLGKRPEVVSHNKYGGIVGYQWGYDVGFSQEATIPVAVFAVLHQQQNHYALKTESAAYAALGKAVREVHRQVPPLPDPRVERLMKAAEAVLEYCVVRPHESKRCKELYAALADLKPAAKEE